MKTPFSHMLLTVDEMGEADQRTIADGCPGILLMERAGAGVAEAVKRLKAPPARVLVVCGPGNNGGDGFVAARLLQEGGYSVRLALVGELTALKGDAAIAAATWSGGMVPASEVNAGEVDIIIDALFGAGLVRALDGVAAQMVKRINASDKPVISVDVPSGVFGDSGQVAGVAVQATRTVTFAARKPAHLLLPGAALCGAVEVVDIGITEETLKAVHGGVFANGPEVWGAVFPRLLATSHKYTRGHALVLSGGAIRGGAARLAARGALRVGAGLVTIAAPPEALSVHAAHLNAIMLQGMDGARGLESLLADRRINTVVLGPALGVGAQTRALTATALAAQRSVVIDADAITSFAGMVDDLAILTRLSRAVLTPHDGEFARLFSGKNDVLKLNSKPERVRAAAALLGCVVLLKGPDTIIAAPDGRVVINDNGTPLLATAGSGDVLAGIIGGLIAQGMPVFEAACAGVWLHAEAAREFGPGLIAEDLPEMLPMVLANLEPAP